MGRLHRAEHGLRNWWRSAHPLPHLRVTVKSPVVFTKKPAKRWHAHALTSIGGILILGSTIYLALAYDPAPGADKPNATDWMQGWGSLLAVLFGALAVIAAGAVYRQAKDDARTADERWKQERAEAADTAREAEQRWKQERAEAADAAREAEQRWRDDRKAMEQRWREELVEIRRSAAAAEEQLELRRQERLEALLAVPLAVTATRVAVGHGQRMADHSLAFGVFVGVQNAGDKPISQVHALITFKPDILSFGAVAPSIAANASRTLSWETTRDQPKLISMPDVPIWDFDTADPSPFWSVAIHFTDIAGRTWRRVDNGPPVEVPAGQLP